MFGLITMIGGHLDADMQYDYVNAKLLAHRHEDLPAIKISKPIMEETEDNENDTDFEDLPLRRHPEDDRVFKQVIVRVCKRLLYFTR